MMPTKKIHIHPINERVILMKQLCKQYECLVYRDIREYIIGFPTFYPIKDQFQIGYLPTLKYISFHRDECIPEHSWIEGFIHAAKKNKAYYKAYRFLD